MAFHLSVLYTFLVICKLALVKTVSCFPFHENTDEEHTVVIFAFSGLRWDSMQLYDMPALTKLVTDGVLGKRKIDAFQTETLPSFITMITGRYPESHAMMANKMKDLKTSELFTVTSTEPKWWRQVKPIWITNQNNGNLSALCYWPGNDVVFNGTKVNYRCSQDHLADPFKELTTKGDISVKVMSFQDRLNQTKSWLNMHSKRPSFIGVYFEEPLKTIMKFGLHSNETKSAFGIVNNVVEEMIDFLKRNKTLEKVNFIVTGESGVTELKNRQEIFLEDYLDEVQLNTYDVIDDGPIMAVYPHNDNVKKALFLKWRDAHRHMAVYNGSNLTKNFHYSNIERTMPIILVADETWRIYPKRVVDNKKALMGFDGKYSSTHSLFIAHGSAFEKHVALEAVGNVDVYNMLCHALQMEPEENSGNKATIEKALKKRDSWYVSIVKKVTSSPTQLILVVIGALMLLFAALYLIIAAIFKTVGFCYCPKIPTKVIVSPKKFLKNNNKKEGGQHLLSDEEYSSGISESDDDFNKP